MVWRSPDVAPVDEPFVGDERRMLEDLLDWHRASLLHKCAGLTGEQLASRAVPPSNLSLLGLIRHLTEVERNWFRRRFGSETVDWLYRDPDNPDAAFDDLDPASAEAEVAALLTEWDTCRTEIADMPLESTYISERWGEMSLRWLYLHMIGEYAQHNGHADLLRERIDGRSGW